MSANASAGGVGQELLQHQDLLQHMEQQPNPVSLSDVTQQCVELKELVVQHQGHLDAALTGQVRKWLQTNAVQGGAGSLVNISIYAGL